MKKIKLAFFIVAVVVAGLFIYQNMLFLLAPANLTLDIWIVEPFFSKGLNNALLIVAFFLAGALTTYFLSLSYRFKTKKTIKELNKTIDEHIATITTLKNLLSKNQTQASQQEINIDSSSEEKT